MRDRDLRASLERIGPRFPALEYEGETIDGRKREVMCAELGRELPRVVLHTLGEACSALWLHHPVRALELAQRDGPKRVRELAELCGTTATAIAVEWEAAKPKPKHRRKSDPSQPARASDTPRGAKSKMLRFWVEPEFLYYVNRLQEKTGLNKSELVRDALWRRIAVVVPRAPLHPPGSPKRKAG